MAWLLLTGTASAQADESCFLERTNAARAEAGLPALASNSQLVEVARRHSREMADSGTIFHNPGLAGEVAGRWLLVGENVGTGPGCDDVHDAFMQSPAHRRNILEPRFNAAGMGTVVEGGAIYVTQVFMQSKGAAAPPAPKPPPPPPPPPPPAPKPPPPPAPKPPPPPPAPRPAVSPRPSVAPRPAPSPELPSPAAPVPPAPPGPPPAPSPSVSVQGTRAARSPSPAPGGNGPPTGMLLAAGGALILGAGAGVGLLLRRLGRRRR